MMRGRELYETLVRAGGTLCLGCGVLDAFSAIAGATGHLINPYRSVFEVTTSAIVWTLGGIVILAAAKFLTGALYGPDQSLISNGDR